MDRWRTILRRWAPREDIDERFYPDRHDEEIDQPVLLNSMGPMAAAFVAARVLRAVVSRRGSLLKPSMLKKLEALLQRGLPEEVIHHCEVEAERILEWINERPLVDDAAATEVSGTPDFDIMVRADLESRLSVARFALEEGYDLELEYFDEATGRWPRLRARLLGIDDPEAADFQTSLLLRSTEGYFEVPLKYVRWMMPVPAGSSREQHEQESGDILEFPGPDDDA